MMRLACPAIWLLGAMGSPGAAGGVWPDKDWQEATPETQGLSAARLDEAAAYALKYGGGSGCIVRHGYLVKEWGDRRRLADIKSATKGAIGATCLGLAVDSGLIQIDDPAQKHYASIGTEVPGNAATGWLPEITIRHLATMTAGFDDGRPPRLVNRPGTAGIYSNDSSNMLAELVTLACREDLQTVLKRKVMDPIGVDPGEWAWRANNFRPRSLQGLPSREFASGITITHRALARIGYLYLREGVWNGQRILSQEFIREATRATDLPAPFPYYAFYWGSNARGTYPEIPRDAFWALGLGDSFVVVCPSLDVVAVRLGVGSDRSRLPGDDADWGRRVAGFFRLVAAAAGDASTAPCPPSRGIGALVWAPKETILRQAAGSDNWPMTWADDDALYAAFGDGRGFEPFTPEKLSLGLARITGAPPGFEGTNIRSPSGEAHGEGPAGKKASGLLSIGGVLYLWARNAANSQLAWSSDHGASWTWADWRFTQSFGCPTFLNFGRDYAGARDDFVYVYSPDADTAYAAADRFVLARAPRTRLRERDAYEFFARLEPGGLPVWTRDLAERGGVFTHAGKCWRSGITHDGPLRRYLWCQTLPGDDPRYAGGLGVYDAPEPWGPWTTLFFAEGWDVGPGETSSFPVKWMSADGRSLHFVFSGDDSFSVRQATLRIAAEGAASEPRGAVAEFPGYFPPSESKGGWRKLDSPDGIRRIAGVEPAKLDKLREWLLASDDRDFAAVVIRRGHIVLEVERKNSSRTDSRRVASVSKAICATVLAIASEQSQQGLAPGKMKFDDAAFSFIPWAHPLSDPRKAKITVQQLLNHTSGLCPEATGAPNEGTWEYVLGLSGDPRTAKLAFDPGTACGYSTHALDHASLVCESVTGMPYDQFAIKALFEPIGVERWWFRHFDGGEKIGRHPTHGLGMPARDLARIAYCMLRGGRWGDRQVIPKWFVDGTAAPTHEVHGPEMRFKINAQTFSHGWELPARLTGEGGRSGHGIPPDARHKPGSGGQTIAFVPGLDLVVTRQTGSSGEWAFEEYLRRACAAVVAEKP